MLNLSNQKVSSLTAPALSLSICVYVSGISINILAPIFNTAQSSVFKEGPAKHYWRASIKTQFRVATEFLRLRGTLKYSFSVDKMYQIAFSEALKAKE